MTALAPLNCAKDAKKTIWCARLLCLGQGGLSSYVSAQDERRVLLRKRLALAFHAHKATD